MAHPSGHIVACLDCDLLQRVSELPDGAAARCRRCGHTIALDRPEYLENTLALTIAAVIALVVANVSPLLELSVSGRQTSTTILGGAQEMWLRGDPLTAALVAFCTVFAPAIHIGIMLTILLASRQTPIPSWVGRLLHWSEWHQSWAMVEVMILGILVALIKIAEMATVLPGIGMFAAGVLVLLLTAITITFDPRDIWQRIEWVNHSLPPLEQNRPPALLKADSSSQQNDLFSAMSMGLVSCESCGLLSRPADVDNPGQCPRCGRRLAMRKHHAIQRTWALIIAALICYIPANLLPVMASTTMMSSENDTIISGVVLLYKTGSWHLALIVLIASVVIPLAKIMALAFLLITIQRRSVKEQRERLQLYRLINFVGRWSMLDVFVVTFTVALIQLQPLMAVQPGTGVLFFASVVVLTLFAAESFDPRLIWDSRHEKGGLRD
ncbi:MAG TPA: paraquat-inducible protein A [Smithella sp.]|nr:paraquat-inducible protein A [Smithella sp.]HOG90014.1 paraquat-inducible protein A [Smithella sp.]